MPINALIVHRVKGGCIVENHHDEDGHRFTSEDIARNANELHAIIERASMFINPPRGYHLERGER